VAFEPNAPAVGCTVCKGVRGVFIGTHVHS
jgi:hypothetical protein